MTPEMKARLDELRAKADLSDAEKAELNLLNVIEKQSRQIAEKDSLIGTKGTEIDLLKKQIESSTGKDKEALEKLLADKQDALDTLKAGLDALKEASAISKEAASKISQQPGHGDAVDPKELEALEAKAYADPKVRAEVEELYKNMDEDDKKAFRSDAKFKKMFLQGVLGTGGEETDDSPWATGVKREVRSTESAEDRLKRIFEKNQQQYRRVPPGSSGRGGRGSVSPTDKPKPYEREVDSRSH